MRSDGALPDPRELIPHRGRFLLLDRLVALEGNRLRAEGDFTVDAIEGHFQVSLAPADARGLREASAVARCDERRVCTARIRAMSAR